MTKREKLIARIRARPVDAAYADVKALLELFGWSLDRTKGSHHIFVKPGEEILTISTVGGRRVRQYHLDTICKRLELD